MEELISFVYKYVLPLIIALFLLYITDRVKNAAKADDLERLTKIVGNVEHKFEKSLAKLNTRNSLIQGRLSQYNSKRDNVLFNLYETGNALMEDLMSYGYNLEESDIIDESHLRRFIKTCERKSGEFMRLRLMAITWFESEGLKIAIDELAKLITIHLMALHEIDSDLNKFRSNIDNVEEIEKKLLKVEYIKEKQVLVTEYIKDTNKYRNEYTTTIERLLKEVLNCYEQLEKQLKET